MARQLLETRPDSTIFVTDPEIGDGDEELSNQPDNDDD